MRPPENSRRQGYVAIKNSAPGGRVEPPSGSRTSHVRWRLLVGDALSAVERVDTVCLVVIIGGAQVAVPPSRLGAVDGEFGPNDSRSGNVAKLLSCWIRRPGNRLSALRFG